MWHYNPQHQTHLACYTSSCALSVRPNRLLCIFKTTGALAFSSLQITQGPQEATRQHCRPQKAHEVPQATPLPFTASPSYGLPPPTLPHSSRGAPSTSTPVLPHSFVPQLSRSAFPRSPGHLDAGLRALLRVWKDPWHSSPAPPRTSLLATAQQRKHRSGLSPPHLTSRASSPPGNQQVLNSV